MIVCLQSEKWFLFFGKKKELSKLMIKNYQFATAPKGKIYKICYKLYSN